MRMVNVPTPVLKIPSPDPIQAENMSALKNTIVHERSKYNAPPLLCVNSNFDPLYSTQLKRANEATGRAGT